MIKEMAVAVLGGLSLLTLSCGHTGEAEADNRSPVRSHTEIIQLIKISDHFQATGTIRAKTSTVLSSKVVGQILSLTVREGDRVHQGQLIAEIDSRDASAHLRIAHAGVTEAKQGLEEADRGILAAGAAVGAAEANRDFALATRKRYDVLRERHSISPQEYDEVDTRYKALALETERSHETLAAAKARRLQVAAQIEQAEAEFDAAQIALGYSRIVSPINGIVSSRPVEPGMLATPGIPLLAIEDDRTYELEVAVEESRVPTITIGEGARIELDALRNGAIDGRVREIVPSSDPATRTYTVRLQLTSTAPRDHTLRSGLFGRALFSAGDRQALVVPESAVIHRGQLEGVYIVENHGVALLRLVKTGKRYAEGMEILSGLTPGTRILTAPGAAVSDGVKIIDEKSGETP